jgi:hypothetical protein
MRPFSLTQNRAVLRTSILLSLGVFLLAPLGASLPGAPGSQLVAGESDQILAVSGASANFAIYEMDYGVPGDAIDNCLLLRPKAPSGGSLAAPPTNKDLRLTACNGKPMGSELTDLDVNEKVAPAATYTTSASAVPTAVYGDVNNNGKYDKGDYVYFTTSPVAAGTAAQTIVPLAATTGVGVWTVRITPAASGKYAAGTFVFSGDDDFTQYGTVTKIPAAIGVDGGTTANRLGAMFQRDDKQWFWAAATTVAGVAKNALVPTDSVRISKIDPWVPTFSVVSIAVTTEQVMAGQPFNVLVEVKNGGKIGGPGLLVTRLDDTIMDAKLTNPISAGDSAKVVIAINAPRTPGSYALKVNEVFQIIEVQGDAATGSPGATDTASLQSRIATLEARLAQLEADKATNGTSIHAASVADQRAKAKSPGLEMVVLLAALAAAAVVLRRK